VKAVRSRLAGALQGLSGDTIAIVLAVGLVLGTFPVYGCPTVFCLLAAFALRLNAPALQLVNQLLSPVQLALLIPFARLGARLLGSRVTASGGILSRFGEYTLHAIAGWLCISLPLGILLYVAASHALRRWQTGLHQLESAA
jgi:uncharacterized protein (DUF2062 family)